MKNNLIMRGILIHIKENRGFKGMQTTNIKEAARRLVEQLPDDATWDDVMRKAYEQQAIESGLADSEAGRVTEVEEVRRKYGLPE